jgi:hypothetical protein
VTNLSKLLKWLTILSTLIALFVFLFSTVSPFYRVLQLTLAGGVTSNYWSYKIDYTHVFLKVTSSQSWFFDYWLNNYILSSLGILWIPPVVFVMQALTLGFGSASLATNWRIIRSVPVCASLTVLALTFYAGYRMPDANFWGEGSYQLGYYLVYPSVALFTLAFALAEVRARHLQSKESKLVFLSS